MPGGSRRVLYVRSICFIIQFNDIGQDDFIPFHFVHVIDTMPSTFSYIGMAILAKFLSDLSGEHPNDEVNATDNIVGDQSKKKFKNQVLGNWDMAQVVTIIWGRQYM